MLSFLLWGFIYGITALLSLLCALYIYYLQVFKYFESRQIPYEPGSFPFGTLKSVFTFKKSYYEVMVNMYNKHKCEKFIGFFQFMQKSVLIIDRDLIKNVLVKDFDHFDGKNIHYNRKLEPLTAHLFALDGQEWKLLRSKIAPIFSTAKLKGMFQTIVDVGHVLTEYVSKLIKEDDVIECKDLFIRYGLANIASTAFGVESDVLTDKSSLFFKMADALTEPTIPSMIRNGLIFYGKVIAKTFNLRVLPKKSYDFFYNLAIDIVNYRENNGKVRNDYIQLLMELRKETKVNGQGYSITMDELAAQAYVFIIAGFETSSNALSFFLYEMALNPEAQRRVQDEVDSVEEISYDTLSGLEYLDMAIDETLRKYAPLGFVSRVCSRDYKVPGTQQVIGKGTQVVISTHALHWDPDLFPDPGRFNPERFSKENAKNIKSFSYMPFGEGPRFCIGMRFAKLSMKAALATLMKRFEVQAAKKTPIPVEYEIRSVNTMAKGGMWLRLVPREV